MAIKRTSIPAMVVVGLVLLALLSANPSSASRGNVVQQRNNNKDENVRNNFLRTRALKSDKSDKKKKSDKSCKSSKKGDDCDEDEISVDEIVIVKEEDVTSKSTKSDKKGKSDKSDKSAKSTKSDKSAKSTKSDKSAKSTKKSDKSGKSGKSGKSSKKTKFDKSMKKSKKLPPFPIEPPIADEGFVPKEKWNQTLPDAAGTGFLSYDRITEYAWYAYNVDVPTETTVVAVSSSETIEGVPIDTETVTVEKTTSTKGRICPLDVTNNGQVIESLCIDINPSTEWSTATSSEIVSVETCYGSVTGAIFKLAVIVKDTSKFLQFDELVGSRMIVYDITLVGKSATARVAESVIAEVGYEGWSSLYGEPTINSRPAFSPDCKTVYATWLTGGTVTSESGGSAVIINMEPTSTTTIATNIEFASPPGQSSEIWRLGANSHLVGLTASKDGKTLYSAINVPIDDSLRSGGMVALDAATGKITQEFAFANEGGIPHNAYTNVVLDGNGHTYHVDSLLGLVKFEGDDLNDGPVWSAAGTDYKKRRLQSGITRRDPTKKQIPEKIPEDSISKPETLVAVGEVFTAYKPALNKNNSTTVYSCGGSSLGNKVDGVMALGTEKGTPAWATTIDDGLDTRVVAEISVGDETIAVNIGSCGGITSDIVFGPSAAAGADADGIYISRGSKVQSLESQNGTISWTYNGLGKDDISKFAVVSGDSVLVANGGDLVLLNTTKEAVPVPTPPPTDGTLAPTVAPVNTPTPVNNPTPAPVNTMPSAPTVPVNTPPTLTLTPTSQPSGASSRHSMTTALLCALPLLVALLR